MSVPGGIDPFKLVVDQWAQSVVEVVAAMTDQRPEAAWQAGAGEPDGASEDAETLWWEQPFHGAPDLALWVAAPRAVWEHAGGLTLRAAGLETVEPAEARNTWLEILGQSLGVVARVLGAMAGREVTCEPGVERAPASGHGGWASVSLRFPDVELPPLRIVFGARFWSGLSARPSEAGGGREAAGAPPPRSADARSLASSRTMDLLLEVDLPVSVSFGKAQLALKDVLKLTTGSIVELNRGVNDQVEVLVNQCLIARGEVVVVEGNYGVRIQEIVSRHDRLRSLR